MAACTGVRAGKNTECILGALDDVVTNEANIAKFVNAFDERFDEFNANIRVDGSKLNQSIREAEQRLKNVTAAIAAGGYNEALASQLAAEQAKLEGLKAKRTAATKGAKVATVTANEISAGLRRTLDKVKDDAPWGREWMRRFMAPVLMTREGEGAERT